MHTTTKAVRRLSFEALETRQMLDGAAPLFLYQDGFGLSVDPPNTRQKPLNINIAAEASGFSSAEYTDSAFAMATLQVFGLATGRVNRFQASVDASVKASVLPSTTASGAQESATATFIIAGTGSVNFTVAATAEAALTQTLTADPGQSTSWTEHGEAQFSYKASGPYSFKLVIDIGHTGIWFSTSDDNDYLAGQTQEASNDVRLEIKSNPINLSGSYGTQVLILQGDWTQYESSASVADFSASGCAGKGLLLHGRANYQQVFGSVNDEEVPNHITVSAFGEAWAAASVKTAGTMTLSVRDPNQAPSHEKPLSGQSKINIRDRVDIEPAFDWAAARLADAALCLWQPLGLDSWD